MNEAGYPRIPGELGNAWTWNYPVLFKPVKGAVYSKVVLEGMPEEELLKPYIEAAQELERVGVKAITTSCGYTALYQQKIQEAVDIPVFCSSLLQVPLVHRMIPKGKVVGVLTIDSDSLTDRHFECVGALETPKVIYGMQHNTEFLRFIKEDGMHVDTDKCKQEFLKVSSRMVEEHPEIGAIVLECTNMPPWAKDVQENTGLPVFDIISLANYVAYSFLKEEPFGYM